MAYLKKDEEAEKKRHEQIKSATTRKTKKKEPKKENKRSTGKKGSAKACSQRLGDYDPQTGVCSNAIFPASKG